MDLQPIPEHPNYKASTDGKIWDTEFAADGRWLNTCIINTGYLKVRIDKVNKLIHRLVAQTFIPNPNNKSIVHHKDGNKLNNYVDNLEWVTQSENIKHYLINK